MLNWPEKQKFVNGEISERASTLRTVASTTTMIVTISVAHPKGLAKELLFDFISPTHTSKITNANFQFERGLFQTPTPLYLMSAHRGCSLVARVTLHTEEYSLSFPCCLQAHTLARA